MRRNALGRGRTPSFGIALLLSAGMATASPVGQRPVNPGSQGIPRNTQPQVTWVGCLVRVEKSPSRPGTGDNTEAGKNESSPFVLKDASPANARNDRATRELGLRTSNVNLAEHVGHQVELTGRFVDARNPGTASSGSKDAQAGASGAAQPAAGANPQHTVFDVTAARTTNTSCQSR